MNSEAQCLFGSGVICMTCTVNHPAISSFTEVSVCLSRLWSGQQSLQGLSVYSQNMSLKGLGAKRGSGIKQEEFKVVIIGDKACGKMALVIVYTQGVFPDCNIQRGPILKYSLFCKYKK